MNLCSDEHDEVCYEGSMCPVCKEISEKNEKDKEIESLEEEIKELKAEVKDLEAKVPQ